MEKKVRVELELTPQAAKKLLDSGSMSSRTLSEDDLRSLADKGVIRAVDYLTDQEMEAVSGWLSQFAGEVVDKIQNRKYQKAAALVVADVVAAGPTAPQEEQVAKE